MLNVVCFLLPSAIVMASASEQPKDDASNPNRMMTALRFVHEFGKLEALQPDQDRAIKVRLMAELARSQHLPVAALRPYFDDFRLNQLVPSGGELPADQMERLLEPRTPASRTALHSPVRRHLDLLTTQFDMISSEHREATSSLAKWIAEQYRSGNELGIICVCTGNTRRSMLAAAMGNLAASYYGLKDLRFYSGGTTPDALNPRTIATLQAIGVVVETTGEQAERGPAGNPNPIYRLQWGEALECREFSKLYLHPANPRRNFAALMVCNEADDACPQVEGASLRLSVTYLDPKAFDGSPIEADKYAERRDEIGRFMLNALLQAHRLLDLQGNVK